jgi:hypothetical protein
MFRTQSPEAHANDAERAARSGLAILDNRDPERVDGVGLCSFEQIVEYVAD